MAKYRVINDIHLFGADPLMTRTELMAAVVDSPHPVIMNGDNLDFSNCKHKQLPEAMQMLILLVDHLKRTGGEFILGNHESEAIRATNFVMRGDVLFIHGDIWMWGYERAYEFRTKPRGAGWFKRNLISKPLSALRHLVAVRPNDMLLANIDGFAQLNPHIKHIVLGHSHPPKPVHFLVRGVKCVIMPRGVHDLEFT